MVRIVSVCSRNCILLSVLKSNHAAAKVDIQLVRASAGSGYRHGSELLPLRIFPQQFGELAEESPSARQ